MLQYRLIKLIAILYLIQSTKCTKHNNNARKLIEGRHNIPTTGSSSNNKNHLQKLFINNNRTIHNESFPSNKEFNNTKRWLESGYSRGFHSSTTGLDDSSLDSQSMYEYKSDSRQNFVAGNSDESYGNDMDTYLKPGIGDYPSDMDGLDDAMKMYGTDSTSSHHHQSAPSNTVAFSPPVHSTGGSSSLDDAMLSDLLTKNFETMNNKGGEEKTVNIKGENLQKFIAPLSTNSASIVSDAINQDEVSPAKVIDNALTSIENEATKMMKEARKEISSGSGEEKTSFLTTADSSKTKGETKEGDMTSTALFHADDVNKALKEATENAPEDDSVTLLDSNASGSGDSSSETKNKQAKEVKISTMIKDEKPKHKTVKHVKGTRRQEDTISGLDPTYSEGYDVDSAVKDHQVSSKLVSSIKQAIKGMDEEETGVKVDSGNEATQRQSEASPNNKGEVGVMLLSEEQNTQSYKESQQQQMHVNPAKQSRFEFTDGHKMLGNEANHNDVEVKLRNGQDAPVHEKEAIDKQASPGKESESIENEAGASPHGKEAHKVHNKKQTKFHEKEQKEEEGSSKVKNDKGHKVNKANNKEKKITEEGNFNNHSPNEPEEAEESQKAKEGESSAENNDGGDLLEDNLMKMDKKKLVKILAKFMRESKKKENDSEKNAHTPTGGNGGGLQAPFGLHPLLLGATGAGHKASGGGSQFVYMNELPLKPVKVDQTNEEELTGKSHDSSAGKVDHDPYVDIGSSDPADEDKALHSHNRQKVTSSKDEKSGGSSDKEEKESEEKEKDSKEDAKEKESKNEDKTSDEMEKSKEKFTKEESKEDGGKTSETNKVNEAKEDEEEASDSKVSEKKEDDKANEKEDDANVSETKEDEKASEAKVSDESQQEMKEKAQHLISNQSLLEKDDKSKEEESSEKSDEKEISVVASLAKNKEEDSKDEQELVDKIMEKEKTYTNKLAADIHHHLSGGVASEEDGSKGAEKNSEAASADEGEKSNSTNDKNITKLIQRIKEKLTEKSKKKQHHGQTANRYDDVYAEIGSFGKRDHGIVKKSFKRHRHAF